MSDSYQAIYDAVRSRISNGDVGRAVHEAASSAFDISNFTARIIETQYSLRNEFEQSAFQMRRPFVLLRPAMFPDGNQWCALYGESLQEGVAGFGDTPEKAAIAFDLAWLNAKPSVTQGKRHRHVNKQDGTDTCDHCGLDLRDEIHWRSGEAQ